jgi:hypothetical protein
MATRAKGKTNEVAKMEFVMQLKKEGKHVAHFATGVEEGEDANAFKDGYMGHDYFELLGKPTAITVTIISGDTLND